MHTVFPTSNVAVPSTLHAVSPAQALPAQPIVSSTTKSWRIMGVP
jgi:hypothetical protein